MSNIRLTAVFVCLLALAAGSAFAQDKPIRAGSDFWVTPGNGSTFIDFRYDPIPGDFFCGGSEPFFGSITLRGAPLLTSPEGALGKTDTIVARLDDAVFDFRGAAYTRIQITALSLISTAPIQTICGDFDVRIGLDGKQPVTNMRIVREDADGGRFFAPVALNAMISFTPVENRFRRLNLDKADSDDVLQLPYKLVFGANPDSYWADADLVGPGFRHAKEVLVDADADGQAESLVMPASNFAGGVRAVSGPRFRIAAGPAPVPHCAQIDPYTGQCLKSHATTTDPTPREQIY